MTIFKGIHLMKIIWVVPVLFLTSATYGQVTFVIDDLPKGTPPGDSIFICGTFNQWSTDPKFLLHKRLDGKYAITLPYDSSFEYKFHRGDWARVETSSRNQYMANRKYDPVDGPTIHVYVANWQDLGGAKPFEIVSFFFFALVFLALTASYFLLQIRNKKKARTRSVIGFLIFLAAVLFGRVVIEVVSLPWQFQMGLLGDISLFVAGPLWYRIITSPMRKDPFPKIHFIPAGLMLCLFIIRFFNPPVLSFLTQPAFGNFVTWDDLMVYSTSALSMAGYYFAGLRAYPRLKDKVELQPAELNFFKMLAWCGGLFVAAAVMKIVVLTGEKESTLMWYNRNLLMTGAGIFILIQCYYVFTYEEVFRVTQPVLKKSDDLESMKTLLHQAMKEKKMFTDPHLTLNDLSECIKIKPHVLSKVINDCFNQNFRDFVNGYRIEEFIQLANKDENKRFTFLALAFEVGFNSKSTFNVAFKKIMNVTPREYFLAKKGKVLKDKQISSTAL